MWPSFKDQFTSHVRLLQSEICRALAQVDEKACFSADVWARPGGGGGETRVISNGNIFEKGGVSVSVVHGQLPPLAAQQLKVTGSSFLASGLSLVIHPLNPFVPTVHANWRYFEVYDENDRVTDAWFGGGTDLTPYYLFAEDAIHFHSVQKDTCDASDSDLYPLFKEQCDNYFVNHHRGNERRGVGGIFFDHCKGTQERPLQFWNTFTERNGNEFLRAYLPIVKKRKSIPFNHQHRFWQEVRRGRYVEFNLLHDRGTLFGLKTNGRTESILMSLPPTARFEYNYQPAPGSDEAALVEVLLKPREWLKLSPAGT